MSSSSLARVRLDETPKERTWYDNLSELYSIIMTMEQLEKAWLRDACTADEYTPACAKLISQFDIAKGMVVSDGYALAQFLSEFQIQCKAAMDRFSIGVPATVERGGSGESRNTAKNVAEATQYYITALDALKLEMAAVDQIQPLIKDLMAALNKIPSLPGDFEGKTKCRQWLATLNAMSAADELDDNQVRQLAFDLESSYNAFHQALGE
jgi:ESCRT-I complex subunit VPS28